MMKLPIFPFILVLFLSLGLGLHLDSPGAQASLMGRPAPEIENETWINSTGLKLRDLRGKVVLLQFWTYG